MQEGDALNALTFSALALAALLPRTRLFVPVRLLRGVVTTPATPTARALRSLRLMVVRAAAMAAA